MLATSSTSATFNNSTNLIPLLNLTKAKERLALPSPRGKGWTKEKVDIADKWYRRFLILAAKYPDRNLIPTMLIDEMWHQHVLDTEQYAMDCTTIFGEFMHHDPYFGSSDNGEEELRAHFAETDALFLAEFGESCTAVNFGGVAQSYKRAVTTYSKNN